MISIYRKEHFNAAHRLHNPSWTAKKNKEVFGKCNNPNFHGHNYELIVGISGEIDRETGYIIDTKLLSNLIQKEVIDRLDHKNLNLDVDEFRDLNPTVENIAVVIHQLLRPTISKNLKLSITLYETPRNYVTYTE